MTDETTGPNGRKQPTRRAPATYGGYVRVSRQGEREDDRFRSPAIQRETIERFASADGIALTMYPDEIDVSGAKAARPTLDGIVAAIEAGELAGMVVARLDRLSRLAPRQRIELFERIEGAGGRILSATESNDVSTPQGRFVRELFLSLARMQWEEKAEGFEAAKASAIANGIAVKARPPFGYRLVEGRHVIEPLEAAIVLECFEARAAHASYSDVLRVFEERTGRNSSRQTMRDMLGNLTYVGELFHGAHRRKGAHDAIVPLELYEAVQVVNAERSGPKRARHGRKVTLLAGIARCAGCGDTLGRSAGAGGKGVVYRCRRSSSKCPARASIYVEALDEYVIERVLEWAGPVADELVEVAVEVGSAEERIVAEQRLEQARAALRGWAENVEAELDDAIAYEAGLRAREALVEQRERELVELGEASELELARSTIRAALTGDDFTVAERRALLAVVLDSVIVRKTPRVGAPASERAELIFSDAARSSG